MGRWAIGVVWVLVACGSSDGGSPAGETGGNVGTGGARASGGAVSSGGGVVNNTGGFQESPGGTFTGDAGGSSPGGAGGTSPGDGGGAGGAGGNTGPDPNLCGTTIFRESLPESRLVLIDQSAPMGEPLGGPSSVTWWAATQQAMLTVVAEPTLAESELALQYFPLTGVTADSCGADYATPAVSGTLPTAAALLTASLDTHSPAGGRPLGVALTGALTHMKQRAQDAYWPAVVLVTRGLGTECKAGTASELVAIARNGYAQEPQVKTFVIGLGASASKADLDAIAKAGGTDHAELVEGDTTNITRPFGEAFLRTREGVANCILETGSAPGIPRESVSVRHSSGSGDLPESVARLDSADDCADHGQRGFYFIDAISSLRLGLCPDTCLDLSTGATTVESACSAP